MRYDFDKLKSTLTDIGYNGNILISKDTNILFLESLGFKDHDKKERNKVSTSMRIASITKLVTAVAILKLFEEDKLAIYDAVKKYIPMMKHKDITIHHLLSNSSGIANFDLNHDFSYLFKKEEILEDLLGLFIDEPLSFTPGERFSYSLSGYLLLQYVIENVTGVSYYDYLKKEIFDLLGMSNTYFEYPGIDIPGVAEPLKIDEKGLRKVDFFDMRIAGAGGGLISTVGDIHKLNCSLLNYRILTKQSVDMIFGKNVKVNDNVYYGYGMVVSIDQINDEDNIVYYHPGGGDGVRSFNSIYFTENMQVIMLSNLDDKDIFNTSREYVSKFLFNE